MEITKSLISSLAPDSASLSAGEGLVKKNKFLKLNVDKDKTIIFGECAGSGKNPYYVSVDFINSETSPTSRCSCPSRKFPCKHAIGLMTAYADGKAFAEAAIPDDIISKREKIEQRSQKKEEQVKEALDKTKTAPEKAKKAAPKKNSAAQIKKLQAQLDGLGIAESLVFSLVRDGIGSITPATITEIEKQAKQMADYYLAGVQKQLIDLASILKEQDKEAMYTAAYEKLVFIHALIKKGKEYLAAKVEDPALLDTKTEIEALLGNVWKSKDLLDAGLAEQDVRLMQLAFTVDENNVIKETDEKGVWLNFNNGDIILTRNIIPKKASKYINTTDSVMGVLTVPVLYRYPGTMNYRVRWDEHSVADAAADDYKKAVSMAADDFASTVKNIKDHLKNPLSNKNPFALVKYKTIGSIGDALVMEDAAGDRLVLADAGEEGWFDTLATIRAIGKDVNKYKACLIRFKYLSDEGKLVASPLTLIGDSSILRLSF